MILRPIASYLMRFDDARDSSPSDRESSEPGGDLVSVSREMTTEAQSEEWRERILEEIRAAAKIEYDALLEQQCAAFAARSIADRALWASDEGSRLGEQFHLALDRCMEGVQASIASILEPFVAHEILQSLLADFTTTLQTILADRQQPPIRLSGSRDLLEIIRSRLALENVTVSVADAAGIDVEAKIGSTLVETCMGEWMSRLRNGAGAATEIDAR